MRKHNVPSTAQNDQLITLIKSLTKAEKRNFKLYVNRLQSNTDVKFVQLFDVLDKLDYFDEVTILKKLPTIKKSQLANLKRHLYKQLLISLRLIHIQKNVDIQIREQLDFARILYGKGLILQSMKLLDRIKTIASDNHQDLLELEIIEFLKLIEERHITRSRQVKNKVESLVDESLTRSNVINNSIRLSNLKIEIHGFYIQYGHVKNEKDVFVVKELFKNQLANIKLDGLTFFEKIYLEQSYVWYYYILVDFEKCYEHAKNWVEIFHEDSNLIEEEPDLYMRGYHYVLTSLFNLRRLKDFNKYIKGFEKFESKYESNLNTVSEILLFLYLDTARLSQFYLSGDLGEGNKYVPVVLDKLKRYESQLDPHRIMVFHFKIALIYFGDEDFDRMIDHLNEIINLEMGQLREDIQCYSRLLLLIGHYELGNFDLLDYQVQSVYRFLDKMKELNIVQMETLNFLKRIIKFRDIKQKDTFVEFKEKLEKISKDPFAKRALLYFDILPWLESKINKKSIKSILKKSYKN